MIALLDAYQGTKETDRFLFVLLAERLEEGGANISHIEMPTWEEHLAFIKAHVYRAWYVVTTVDGEMIGAASITPHNELGIVIRKQFRGAGYAREAVLALIARHEPLPGMPSQRSPHYLANIRVGNNASIALFESIGFKPLQLTYAL